jgi:hypothetical protein
MVTSYSHNSRYYFIGEKIKSLSTQSPLSLPSSAINPAKHSFLKKYLVVFAVCVIVFLMLSLPLVPTSELKQGKETFILEVGADRLKYYSLEQQIKISPSVSDYLDVNIIDDDGSNRIIFESSDWILDIDVNTRSIASNEVVTSRYDTNENLISKRNESLVAGLYTGVNLNYTDKSSKISTSFDKVLVSESVSGVINLDSYLKAANKQWVSTLSIGEIEVVNKATNVTETGYDYDSSENVYVQNVLSEITYDLNYTTHVSGSTSILLMESGNIRTQILAAIISTLVGAIALGIWKKIQKKTG